MFIATILPLLMSVTLPLPAADAAALDTAVTELFRPYGQGLDTQAVWERPIFSAEVNALIAHWQRVLPPDEPDRLNDGDWLCQCQDWDERAFRTSAGAPRKLADDMAELDVKIDLGFPEAAGLRDARLIFRREDGAWKLDDIFAPEAFPQGLKQTLRETIAEDEAMAAQRGK